MVRKITEISSLWTFPGDFLISVHSIIAVSLTIMIAEKSKEVWLMKQRYYLALTTEEWRLMIESLITSLYLVSVDISVSAAGAKVKSA